MLSLFRTLSYRYVSRRRVRAGLIALSVALGVATLVATQALNWTMAHAAVFAAHPTSGFADFIVSNGELPIPRSLEVELKAIPGIADVEPRVVGNAFAPQLQERQILVLGVDVVRAAQSTAEGNGSIRVDGATLTRFGQLTLAARLGDFEGLPLLGDLFGTRATPTPPPALVGRGLFDALPEKTERLTLRRGRAIDAREFSLAGPYDADGFAAALAGFVAVVDLSDAARLFELNADQVHRFDITLAPGADPRETRRAIAAVLGGRASVGTFAEQSQSTQNVMAAMQTGFSLCGLAALIVGLFLVYNALSVTVTERRHEIGVLRSLGATRGQILGLFAGEATLLGFFGSLAGIPMGLGLAQLGLRPMRDVLSEVFFRVDANQLYVSWHLYAIALIAGMTTTLLASVIPAFRASNENPADAVRKVLKAASVQNLVLHVAASLTFAAVGALMIFRREDLPARWGTLGGMCIVLIGGLLASPFLSGIIARMIQPGVRRFLGLEWRLAADNIVRSPGRTGLVIGALAAGVSLVMQTGGVIASNRSAIRSWLDDYIAADLIVTSGSAVGAGGQTQPIPEKLVDEIRAIEGVDVVMPVRVRKVPYAGTQVMLLVYDAGVLYSAEKPRHKKVHDIELYRQMDETAGGVLISENMAALHKLRPGDRIALPSPAGELTLTVVGAVADYSWNHGVVFLHRRDYLKAWGDRQADVLDVYLKPNADVAAVQSRILTEWGGTHGLFALTHDDLKVHIDSMIEKIYGVAYAQLIVVMLVAGLGVVTALLIAVLQRQHEIGLLRAVGASRDQVIRVVLAEACLMGLIGALIGVLVGIPLEWYVLNVVMLEEAGVLFPVVVPWRETLFVVVGALATALIAGLGPAIYAVRQRIPDTIAYE